MSDYRFEVALSFPGEYRRRVRKISELLATTLGRERVLYDKFFEAEFARPNLNVYLPSLYKQSRLLVFFHCAEYARKEWTGLEWRVGLDLLKRREDERLMFLRLDDAEIDGLYSGDGYLDIRKMTDKAVAARILERLGAPPIEQLVRALRAQTLPEIRNRCGTIRVLTMERPIELAGIYTDINLLERRAAHVRKTREELIEAARQDDFYRFGIRVPIIERVPGFAVFASEQRVIIYGKPGAGKTTFLKHCALKCAAGEFRPDLIPVFITLKHFAESEGSPSLFTYIRRMWNGNRDTETILRAGHALVLLDGLDEVQDADFSRVRKNIEELVTDCQRCSVAITCRIAAREYVFPDFREVEMADFDEHQIRRFAQLWFKSQGEEQRGEAFLQKLNSNPPIFGLASSPLLLTLLLLIYEDRNDFYGTRAELYRDGLEVLLRKWDGKRAIERDRPYGLSISTMEMLLEEIAYRRFLVADYFFEQESLEKQVTAFFAERELLRNGDELVPEKVLNSMESHLGLLAQRAAHVYSFSHLTFQEFLTARRIARKPTLISEIAPFVGDPRWHEVWLLLATMMDPDDLLPQLKRQIDALVQDRPSIQNLLAWCCNKATNVVEPDMKAGIRAAYLCLYTGNPKIEWRFITDTEESWYWRHYVGDFSIDEGMMREIKLGRNSAGGAIHVAKSLGLWEEMASSIARSSVGAALIRRSVALSLAEIAGRGLQPADFARKLEDLAVEMAKYKSPSIFEWNEKLRSLAMRFLNIGYDFGLSSEDATVLDRYESANLFLLDCIEAAKGVTNKTRRFIEQSMLLPADEIRKIEAAAGRPASA